MKLRDTNRSGLDTLHKAVNLLGLLPTAASVRLVLSSDESIRLTHMLTNLSCKCAVSNAMVQ